MSFQHQKRLVVLASGSGTNLQAIIDRFHRRSHILISAVISDQDSQSLKRAIATGVPSFYLPKRDLTRKQYDEELARLIDIYHPDFIILAGFMRILSPGFVAKYRQRIINIHPSLLPKYKGLNTHQRVLDHGDKLHGTSVHYVSEALDSGRIIAQKAIPVTKEDNALSLENRIKALEHQLYPEVIQKLCDQV